MDERIGVLGFGGHAPDRVMTNDDWADVLDTTDDWITQRTGIKERRIAADHETTSDLAVAAAELAIGDAGLAATDLDEIIIATDTPDMMSPDTASFVQHKLGAREIPAYDLGGSGCAGFVMSLDIARSRAVGGRHVLVVGVEILTRFMDWSDRGTAVLFGDAAGAVVVGPGADAVEVLAATGGTDGTHTAILGLPYGGTLHPISVEVAERGDHRRIVMNGREVFRQATRRMAEASETVLAAAGVSSDDVALVIPHQANLRIVEAVRKTLDLPGEKIYTNLQSYGNTGSASVPLAMWEAYTSGRIKPGDLVLLTAFGAGFHWSAALLRF